MTDYISEMVNIWSLIGQVYRRDQNGFGEKRYNTVKSLFQPGKPITIPVILAKVRVLK